MSPVLVPGEWPGTRAARLLEPCLPTRQAAEPAATMNAMEQFASSTGGKAYFNTNDLNAPTRHAIDDGANDYTLGYSPTEKKMDGSYRQIEVKVAKGKYKLAYRHQLGVSEGKRST
jgi:VWFA-related protein